MSERIQISRADIKPVMTGYLREKTANAQEQNIIDTQDKVELSRQVPDMAELQRRTMAIPLEDPDNPDEKKHRINILKQEVENGTYQIQYDKIAEHLLDDELLRERFTPAGA